MSDGWPVDVKFANASWRAATVADICDLRNGHGFGPEDWTDHGLPIIRIQNLNGGKNFDYFAGKPDPRWLVEPGQLLFSWAGTKGVSFGPTIWRGPRGVLNQHIFKVHAKDGIDTGWLYWALRHVTDRIESDAHGFKATLVHVKKSDIDRQTVHVPCITEQRRIAEILSTWDRSIAVSERLLTESQRQKQALGQSYLSDGQQLRPWSRPLQRRHASEIFEPVSMRGYVDLPLLSVMQDVGVVPRDSLDRKVVMPDGSTEAYKLVEPGNFVISLRSFEGGLEYSRYRGLVSPAYTVIKPLGPICDDFYRHYFKSSDFIGRLAVAVIGIRDGKQISYDDFSFIRLPAPSLEDQTAIAAVLNDADALANAYLRQLEALRTERRALMADLLTGKRRARLAAVEQEQ